MLNTYARTIRDAWVSTFQGDTDLAAACRKIEAGFIDPLMKQEFLAGEIPYCGITVTGFTDDESEEVGFKVFKVNGLVNVITCGISQQQAQDDNLDILAQVDYVTAIQRGQGLMFGLNVDDPASGEGSCEDVIAGAGNLVGMFKMNSADELYLHGQYKFHIQYRLNNNS